MLHLTTAIHTSECHELTAYSGRCTPELILAKSQSQTRLSNTRAPQQDHLNPESMHWSAQIVTVLLGPSVDPWERFPHGKA